MKFQIELASWGEGVPCPGAVRDSTLPLDRSNWWIDLPEDVPSLLAWMKSIGYDVLVDATQEPPHLTIGDYTFE